MPKGSLAELSVATIRDNFWSDSDGVVLLAFVAELGHMAESVCKLGPVCLQTGSECQSGQWYLGLSSDHRRAVEKDGDSLESWKGGWNVEMSGQGQAVHFLSARKREEDM